MAVEISNSNVSLSIPPALHLLHPLLLHSCTPLPSVLVFVVHLSIHQAVSHPRWSTYYRMTEGEKQRNGIFLVLFFKSRHYRCPVNDNINDQNVNCFGQASGSNAVRRPMRHGNSQTSINCRSQLNEMTHSSTNFSSGGKCYSF